MSRIGKKPVEIPPGITMKVEGPVVAAKGPQGELALRLPPALKARLDNRQVLVERSGDDKRTRSLHGTYRSLIAGMVAGVNRGYTKELEIQGVGFRAQLQGKKLLLTLGYSHPIEYTPPEGIKLVVPSATAIQVSGPDKQRVGDVSARIRAFARAEPYKGKGVRYRGEHVRRKVGKTVA